MLSSNHHDKSVYSEAVREEMSDADNSHSQIHPAEAACRQDLVRDRRLARHRACHRAKMRARRRQCGDRGEDRRGPSEITGDDLHRGAGDRGRRRPSAAAANRHPRRRGGEGRDREDGLAFRRPRHSRQQCERDQPHDDRGDRDEALRSDASDQCARHFHGVEIRHPSSRQGGEPAYPHALAPARHEGEMVCAAHRLFDGEIRHEPRGARPCGRASSEGHRGQRLVAAHHDRDRCREQPPRRRHLDARLAHA